MRAAGAGAAWEPLQVLSVFGHYRISAVAVVGLGAKSSEQFFGLLVHTQILLSYDELLLCTQR